jgi:hypothetical protein
MLEMKKLAELYWGECAPFIRRKCDTDEACQKEENRLKELWAKECKKLKEKIFPNEEKCAKDQRGRFVYTECKDMCEKCLGGMQ